MRKRHLKTKKHIDRDNLIALGESFLMGLPTDIARYMIERADPNGMRRAASILVGEWLSTLDGKALWEIVNDK